MLFIPPPPFNHGRTGTVKIASMFLLFLVESNTRRCPLLPSWVCEWNPLQFLDPFATEVNVSSAEDLSSFTVSVKVQKEINNKKHLICTETRAHCQIAVSASWNKYPRLSENFRNTALATSKQEVNPYRTMSVFIQDAWRFVPTSNKHWNNIFIWSMVLKPYLAQTIKQRKWNKVVGDRGD